MLSCPLSLRERVRVRVPKARYDPSPPALSRGERELREPSLIPEEVP